MRTVFSIYVIRNNLVHWNLEWAEINNLSIINGVCMLYICIGSCTGYNSETRNRYIIMVKLRYGDCVKTVQDRHTSYQLIYNYTRVQCMS